MSVGTSVWPAGWRTLLLKGWLSEICLKSRGQPGKNWDLGTTIRQHILSTAQCFLPFGFDRTSVLQRFLY